LSWFGGGKEVLFAIFITFIWSSRSKFFYYLFIFGIDKIFLGYFKLVYANPRPYMIDTEIIPVKCSDGFGLPSGHASSSSVFAIAIFLDYFHGSDINSDINKDFSKTKFHGYFRYIMSLLLALFWAASIPFTRFILGVHSLDQILYGSTMGIWAAFTMHFLVRDNLIKYVENIIKPKNETNMKDKD